KVRNMWTFIMETLESLKKEKEVVDSVIDAMGNCVLDGAEVTPQVPQFLMRKVESNRHEICRENIYEDEKLNFLTIIQLLNAALMALRDENGPCGSKELPVPGSRVQCYKEMLRNLKSKSLEIEQWCCMTSGCNSRQQEDWELKWKSFLGHSPFNSVLDQHSVSSSISL
ncbi:HAUS6 protein, partial [Upupa epops]|nr:HAUS6 protein [Upupa epops]